MKVAILICAHCRPEILKLTLGTWLEQYDRTYDAKVYVSLHENYEHYCDKLDEITSMSNVDFSFVKEVDWNPADMMRYSKMHARALVKLMRRALDDGCTHMAILDHDLILRDDFVRWCLDMYGDCDLVGGFMDDAATVREAKTDTGIIGFAPKLTVWNLFISKHLAELAIASNTVRPMKTDKIVYDTFALAYSMMDQWKLKRVIVPCKELESHVEHLWSMSFNFGVTSMVMAHEPKKGHGMYQKKVEKYIEVYNERFPEGIDELLGKLDMPS